jgi:hypothetical protein
MCIYIINNKCIITDCKINWDLKKPVYFPRKVDAKLFDSNEHYGLKSVKKRGLGN